MSVSACDTLALMNCEKNYLSWENNIPKFMNRVVSLSLTGSLLTHLIS